MPSPPPLPPVPSLHAPRRHASIARGAAIAGLGLSLVLGGCAVTSSQRQHLAAYQQASAQVEQGAEAFLADLGDPDRTRRESLRAAGAAPAADPPEYPATYQPPPADGLGPAPTPDQRARVASHRALQALHDYNAALVALAEGRDDAQVRTRVEDFGNAPGGVALAAGQALPAFVPFLDIASVVVKQAQDAADRRQLIQAVQAGREPVGVILSTLEAQTPSLYRLSVVDTSQAQQALAEQVARAGAGLRTLFSRHAAPADAATSSGLAALQAEMADIGRRTRTLPALPVAPSFTAGRPAFDAGALEEARALLQILRDRADRYGELVARQNAFHAALDAYVMALRQTGRGFDTLQRSLTAPADPLQEVPRLLEAALVLRQALDAWHHPTTPP